MIDLTCENLRKLYGKSDGNPYKQCWDGIKEIISNNALSSLMSDSEYADGKRTAYQEMYAFMKVLEKSLAGEKK